MKISGEPPPPPRQMPFSVVGTTSKFALLFGAIWCLVGGILVVLFTVVGGPIWDDWILDERGVETQARPLGVEATPSTRGNWERIYTIRFQFIDREGEAQEADAGTTDHTLIARARAGSSMAIEYDPDAPATRVRLSGESASRFGKAIFVPLGFVVAGLAFVVLGWCGARRDRALYRDGAAIEARVVAVTPTVMRLNRRRVMRVTYTFHQSKGVVHGTWKTTDPPTVESPLWVIYDPKHPERSMAVPP
jgi:hypothetical protein